MNIWIFFESPDFTTIYDYAFGWKSLRDVIDVEQTKRNVLHPYETAVVLQVIRQGHQSQRFLWLLNELLTHIHKDALGMLV